MVLASKGSVHETGLGDRTNDPGQPHATPPAIVAVLPDPRVASGSIQLEKNDRRIDMVSPRLVRQGFDAAGQALPLAPPAKLTLPITVPEAAAPDYAVLWPDQDGSARPWVKLTDFEKWAKEIAGAIDPAAPIAIADLFKDLNHRPKDFPLAILKISRRLSLEQIFKEIQDALPAGAKAAFEAKRKKLVEDKKGLIADTDAAVIEPDWVGLAIFDAPIDFEAFPLLKAIVPTDRDAPRLSFLTVSPREAGKANPDIAMSGAIDWTNRDTTTVVQADQKQEAKFKPVGPIDQDQLVSQAVALIPQDQRGQSSSTSLEVSIVGGPTQRTLRPLQMEDPALGEHLEQSALYGENRLFDRTRGSVVNLDGSDLVVGQERGASIRLTEQGSMLFRLSLEDAESRDRMGGFGGLVIIEEVVRERLGAALGYAAATIERIDPTQRLTHLGVAAHISGAQYRAWQTRARQAASSGCMQMGMGQEERSPITMVVRRAGLRLDQTPLIEDILVPLRRQFSAG